ncbi:hypothetical protein JCGZ_22091 [Jatropha curcas]|uniref:Aminotransferase-like plant mobile domain-containing protein n=1 Tax=Jatropha curcas TaxID=180498 RepID=A0A067JT45_JATCU|nr:hypothetical protein JCGZ_22091 [Jatropha curcas]
MGFGPLLCTSQNKGDPAVLACLQDLSQVGSFDWATLGLAHLYYGLDVWTRGSGEPTCLIIRPLEVWSYEYCIYPGGPSGDSSIESRRIPRYPEYWRSFLNDRELSDLSLEPWDCEAWRTYPGREARLPEVLEYIQERKTHKTAAHYRAEAAAEAVAAPTEPVGVVLGDVPFPPGMEVVLDPGLGLGSGIIIPADLRQAPPPVQLDPEHTTHVPTQKYQEICQRFGFARSYIGRLYSERHELDQSSIWDDTACSPSPQLRERPDNITFVD